MILAVDMMLMLLLLMIRIITWTVRLKNPLQDSQEKIP